MVQILIIQTITKQYNHQSISWLVFQMYNFDIYTENHVFDANSQQCVLAIYISFGSHTNLMEIYRDHTFVTRK